MEEVHILVLDLSVASGLGGTLRDILESCGKPRICVEQKSIRISEPELLTNETSESVCTSHPHLLFLVVPSNYPEYAGALIQSIRGKLVNLPIIILLEEGKPDQIIEVRGSGLVP